MQSLIGFRPPQFSEEAAWLPGWLQQQDFETKSSYDGTNIGKSFSQQHMEEFLQQHNAAASHQQSTQEDGYKSCHLFLSGDDSSPLSLVQPIDNVVQFHLHLSLDCSSENLPTTLEDISEAATIKSSHALSVQCVQIPIVPEGSAKELKVDNFAALGSGCNNVNKGEGHERNATLHEVNHMDDAIELSIAASEALVIHEVFKDELFSKRFPASTVLEAALQVKQARLESWKESHESCNHATEEIPEIDSLSELEDLIMEDAFQDVGLSASDSADLHFHDFSLSHVKDTLASQTQRCSSKLEKEGTFLHGIDILQPGDSFTKLNLKDIESESQLKVDERLRSFSNEGQRKPTRDPYLVADIIPVARESDHISDCLKKANFPVLEGNSFQASIGSPTVQSINVAGEGDELPKVFPNRFESRWFGGWTGLKKEVLSHDQVKCNAIKSIPEPFVGETSYFSESADIAPDMSSFVARKQDERVIVASQLSVPSEGLCNKAKEMILLSQDIVTSSNLSLDDTLCSVVPCSISSDHLPSPSAVYNHVRDEKQQCFGPTTECATNLQKNLVLDNQAVHGKLDTTPKINRQGVHVPVRREVTSLRTYSVLPGNGIFSEKGYCFNTSFSLGRNDVLMLKPVGQTTNKKGNCDDTPRDGNEFTVSMPKNTSSPLILKAPRRRFQASKAFQHDFGTEKDGKQTTEDQDAMECPKRKRVRFSETETEIQRRKEPRKSDVALKSCHTPKTARNLRPQTSYLESRTQELKKRLINSCARVGRRLMLRNMEFLVTGFSWRREKKLEELIKKYGGTVLSDIPRPTNRGKRCKGFKPQAVPVVLCSKKLQTIKFLYGCAVNAFMLKDKWLTDSICEGCIIPPEKYMVVKKCFGKRFTAIGSSVENNSHSPIFDNLGIMLHGEKNFCTDMAKIVKHGGGQVFKTLLELVQNRDSKKILTGIIVTENERSASRHLKHCASEGNIPITSAYWIIRSLHLGKLLPLKEKTKTCKLPTLVHPEFPDSVGLSQEI